MNSEHTPDLGLIVVCWSESDEVHYTVQYAELGCISVSKGSRKYTRDLINKYVAI